MMKHEYFKSTYDPVEVLLPDTCLGKAADDEPIFVLRANDPIAADVVEIWATLASKDHEYEKTVSAKKCAHKMRVWLVADLERRLAL